MGSFKERLIVDVESGSAVLPGRNSSVTADGGEYVRLAESADQTTAAAFSRDGSRRSLRIASTVLVTLCCLIVALHGTVSLYERIDVLVRRGRVAPPALLSCNELEAAVHKRLDDPSLPHPHRTSFHYQPAKNWMNDPNAPMYYKGYYHLFHQYNPFAAVWGDIAWAHAVSTDLVHWLYLENALEPDQWYDKNGVWSGSATIGPDGVPFILYTGVKKKPSKMDGHYTQMQNMAVPADPSDPLLRKWIKVHQNPIATHPANVSEEDFRDPSTAWQQRDGSWMFTVGGKIGTRGVAFQYQSTDLRNWTLQESRLYELPEIGMLECVDFFKVGYSNTPPSGEVPDTYVFKASVNDEGHDYYTIGTYDEVARKFIPTDQKLDIGHGFRLDYGKYYAAKSMYDPVKNRNIMWAWVNESDTMQMDIDKGWSSVLGIPRSLAVDSRTGVNLIQWPIEEVNALRGAKQSKTDVKLEAGAVVEVEHASGGQLDVEVVFEYPDISAVTVQETAAFNNHFDCSQGGSAHRGILGPFGLLVFTDNDFQEQTALFFYISRTSGDQWTTTFCSDQSRSSLLPGIDKTVYGSKVTVSPTEDSLLLRVLVDRSIVESFVQGGQTTITSRVYPKVAVDNLANLYLFNNGTIPITVRSLDAYHMSHVIMHPF
jgi:beta-fructofuranosidase